MNPVFLLITLNKCFLLGDPFGKSTNFDASFTDIQVSVKKCRKFECMLLYCEFENVLKRPCEGAMCVKYLYI